MAKPTRVHKCSREEGFSFLESTALDFYETMDTPRALTCWILLKKREYEQLIRLEVDPLHYENRDSYFSDAQATAFFQKYPLDTSIDKAAVAREKFLAAEEQCKDFNINYVERLRHSSLEIHTMKKIIRRILGPLPKMRDLHLSFGPGATSAVSGDSVTIPDKLAVKHCSRTAIPHMDEWLLSHPHIYSSLCGVEIEGPATVSRIAYDIVDYNTLTTVPKNGKTDRCICIEPHWNVPLQLAHGTVIRNRLLAAGLDLSKQQEKNRRYAQEGSLRGTYSTIDLSSASDTISSFLVLELLPQDWFERLDDIRSHYTNIGTNKEPELIENEKFSSMGNGFTFELETLIFYAAVLAVKEISGLPGAVMAYGDDIIVPTAMSNQVLELLNNLGFTVNKEKSCITGPFRESCGGDFFLGLPARPFFQKSEVKYETDKFKTANSIRKFAVDLYSFNGYADRKYLSCWERCVSKVPKQFRLFGPQTYGDNVIFTPMGERYQVPVLFGVARLRVCLFRPSRKQLSLFSASVQLAAALYGGSTAVPLRNSGSYHIVETSSAHWCRDSGSWAHYAPDTE